MALNALRLRLRLRRALSMSSIFGRCKGTKPLSTTAAAAISGHSLSHPSASSRVASLSPCLQMSRRFHSTPLTLSASRSYEDDDKFDPDTILFEGCDYKHWLITLDFPKEPEPSAEEKLETYVQTLAKVVGSVEEAKKRMYACSTTTYNGFQAEIDEETAKKFEGMPGVVFVLPDSYIDPVNKEYGGDKYINGRIIPRPPPVQYGRTRRPNRNYDQRPRHQMSNQQVNPVYDQQGSMRGDGMGYTPQQNIPPPQNFQPHNNYGLLGQANNYAHGRDNEYPARARNAYQGDTGSYMPTNRGNFNQGSNYPQGQMADFSGYQGNNYPQGRTANFSEYQGNNHPQGQMGNFSGDQRSYAAPGHTGFLGDSRGYAPAPQLGGSYGQTGTGTYGQGGVGPYGPGASGNYGPGATSGYEPSYTARGENQRVGPQTPQQGSNMQREQRDYTPAGQTAMNQERN